MGSQTAFVFLQKRKELVKITSGSKELDKLLGGGFETGSITEVFGDVRCGKTQLCHQLAVTCQLPVSRGGGNGDCYFIDTEGNFRPERLIPIAERYQLDGKEVLRKVIYARAYNYDHQNNLLIDITVKLSESYFALIIVDNSTSLYRSGFNDVEEFSGQFLLDIKKIKI